MAAVLLLVACLLPLPATASEEAGQHRAFLELEINGTPAGEALVLVRGTEIWIDAAAFDPAGLSVPTGERTTADGRAFVRLSSLAPQITGALDPDALVLRLIAEPSLLGRRRLSLEAGRPAALEYRRSTSAFVNYAVDWSSATSGSLALESGVTLGPALVSTQIVTDRLLGTRRGPTSVTFDSRTRLQRWVLGDAIGATGTLGGALPLAGVTLSRAYDLDPYFVRHPTVGLSGALASPGTIDVYVNDRLVRREAVPAGVIALDDLPVPTGAGSARIVLRDAFGREQEIGGSYYVTTMLLAPGLHQYQYAAGVERRAPATRNWEYGGPILMATHRVGLTDAVTFGGRLEGSGAVVSGGPLAVVRLGRLGAFEMAGALSGRAGGVGHAWSTAYSYTSGPFSLGAAVRAADRQYATLATHLDRRATVAVDAGLTVSAGLWPGGSTSATWQTQRHHGTRDRSEALSLSNSVRLRRETTLYVTLGRTRLGAQTGLTLFAGLTRTVGRRDTVGASLSHTARGTAAGIETQRSAPLGEGYGYRVRAEAGPVDAVDGDVRYQSRWGRYDVRQSQFQGGRSTSLTVAGALVAIGGQVHATRPVEQSFALLRVPGAAQVRAYVSHQEIGRTDRRGDVLVPNLLPYYGNVLSIADEDVPLALTVQSRQLTVAPPYRGGAVVVFPVHREQRAMGRIIIGGGDGTEVPAYGHLVVTAAGSTVESPIGADGAFYLEGMPPGTHDARAVFANGTCTFRLAVPESDAPVTSLGDVRCEAVQP